MLDEKRRKLEIASRRRVMQRSIALPIPGADAGAEGDQHPGGLAIPGRRRPVQQGTVSREARIGVRAARAQ